MKWNCRTRCALICVAFIALFSCFSFRLVYLQINKHDAGTAEVAGKHIYKQTIYAERGVIRDATGEVLALNVPVATVVADATHVNNIEALVPLLVETLDLPEAEVRADLSGKRRYVRLKREVPLAVTEVLREKLKAQKLQGIYLERDYQRVYPNGSMLCHVLGFTDINHIGIDGIESSNEAYLRGENGFRFIEHDRTGAEIVPYRGLESAPRDGFDVNLTIDLHLQNIVENELDAAMREFTPRKATIILMDPETGAVLAMANRPAFDINKRNEARPEEMKNSAVIDMLEPGSTFKIVTAAAALNEKKVRPDTAIFCENGLWNYGGKPLHDHHGYGELTVRDILIKSSNIGAAKLALSVGEQKFYDYICNFGFGQKTGIELPAEISGVVHPPQSWRKISITRISMGHGVGVTPLQMITAMAAIANGGKLVAPRIVKSITKKKDGEVLAAFKPAMRRVISEETAQQVGEALRGVVSDRGTAVGAAVPGFTICGKTGTAQKVDPKGGYEHGKYIVSFAGYMPAEHPAFVAIIILDDAHTKTPEMNYGGVVAGPIFAHIAEKAAPYLNLEPHEERIPLNRAIGH